MTLAIVSLSVNALFAILYIIVRLKVGGNWGTIMRAFATYSYAVSSLLALLVVSQSFNVEAYVFIMIALVLTAIADILGEEKDSQQNPELFLNISVTTFAAHKILSFVALIFLIGQQISVWPVVISAAIAAVLTAVIMIVVKMLRTNLQGFAVQTTCYFFIAAYLATLAVWYVFVIPQLLLFTLFTALIFISDIILIKLNFGNQRLKQTSFVVHKVLYYAAQTLLVAFIFFTMFRVV